MYEPPSDQVPFPDTLDVVLDLDSTMSLIAAERLQRIDELRRGHLMEAERGERVLTDVVLRGLRLELAAAMRITEYTAGNLIALAEALMQRYPSVMTDFRRGEITERHAEVLVGALDEIEPTLRDELLDRARMLAKAEPVGTFRRELRTLIDTARVVTLAERHEEALTRRRVCVEPDADGMAWTHLFAPAVEAQAGFDRATAMAKVIRAQEGETRTLDQIRADVFCDLLTDGTTTTHPSEARGIRATVVVTVPALSLLDGDDAAAAARGADPAVVEGIGPIPIDRARALCGGDATWMRVLTHPESGMVLSVGRAQYSPPAALRRLVKWRADRCMAPGCGIPAARCEVDHTVAWEDGGSTSLQNLAPVCRGHHRVKHHGGWQVRQVPDSGGAVEWTSPAGRQYVVEPKRRVPAFTVSGENGPPGESGRAGRGARSAPPGPPAPF